MHILKRARIRYILHRHAIPAALWLKSTENLPVLQGLTAVEKAHLRELTTLFLYEKNLVGTQGLVVNDVMRVIIASQACLPILSLGLNCLVGWIDVIVYPGAFKVSRDSFDTAGVLHHQEHVLSGECWSRGPIILSWADILQDQQQSAKGSNVIIHEIAHKLDGLNGTANCYPPLHYQMSVPEWTIAMSEGYEKLLQQVDKHEHVYINPYAAISPAEFFAVVSECFFCLPAVLQQYFPEVYQQLRLYYRQAPLDWLPLAEA